MQTNYETPRKKSVIARKTSACNEVVSALGALGRMFESCRPDLDLSDCQNPPWEKIGKKHYISNTFFPTPYNP